MTVRQALALRSAHAQDTAAAVDVAGPGLLRIYTGAQPTDPDTAATGTLLLEYVLNVPAFTELDGVLTLDTTGLATDDALADGTVGYGRFLNADEDGVLDLAVADGLTVSDTTLETGQTVAVDSCNITY